MKKLHFGAAAALALCTAAPSSAATFITSYGLAAGDNTIAKFNQTSNTLSSVTFEYKTKDTYQYYYPDGDTGQQLYVDLMNSNFFTLYDASFNEPFNSPGSLQLYTDATYTSDAIDLTSGVPSSGTGSFSGSVSVTFSNAAILNALTGSGNFVGTLELYDVDGSFVLDTNGDSLPESVGRLLPEDEENTLTVTYVTADDATAAVPEPGTWTLMLGGFGMVGFAARRRSLGKRDAVYA